MSNAITWLGIVIGTAGFLFQYFRSRSSGASARAGTEPAMMLALVLTILFWGISMFQQPPFSSGQTLGLGFLIGGLSGVIAGFLGARLTPQEAMTPASGRISSHAMSFLALLTCSVTFLLFRGNPQWAMIGYAIGAVMAGILYRYFVPAISVFGNNMETWALFSVVVSSGIVIAILHFNQPFLRIWWALPILVATTALIASFIGMELQKGEGLSGIPTLVSGAVTIVLCTIFAWRLVADWNLLGGAVAGIISMAVVAWISATCPGADHIRKRGVNVSALVTFAVVGFVVVAFRIWSGLGIAIGLIAAWSVISPNLSTDSPVSRTMIDAFSLGTAVLLFRLFIESYAPELGRIDLRIHYTFIGALIGILLPMILIPSISSAGEERPKLVRVAAMGLIAAAAPLLIFLIWEIKAVLGFMFGVTACSALLCFLRVSGECTEAGMCRYPGALLILGAELTTIQFVGPLAGLDLTRTIRIVILAAAVVAAIAYFAVSESGACTASEES